MPASSYNELFGLGSHPIDAEIDAWLPLQDDAANTVLSDASGATDGVLGGGDDTEDLSTAGPNGWLPKSLDFDGTSDFGSRPSISFGEGDFTIGCWVYLDSTTGYQIFLGKDVSGQRDWTFGIGLGSPGKLGFTPLPGNVCNSSADLSASTWTHVAAIRSSGTVSLYINGVLDGSREITRNFTATNNICIACREFVGFEQFLNGRIADVLVATRALSVAELGQWIAGLEPLNTVASTVLGSLTQGDTLTNSAGSWDSQSNGTVTISRQWYRANDASGTGAVAISGETGTTYDSQAADLGKYVACQESASNNGGNDSAEDTFSNWRGPIVASGPASSPFFFRNNILSRGQSS